MEVCFCSCWCCNFISSFQDVGHKVAPKDGNRVIDVQVVGYWCTRAFIARACVYVWWWFCSEAQFKYKIFWTFLTIVKVCLEYCLNLSEIRCRLQVQVFICFKSYINRHQNVQINGWQLFAQYCHQCWVRIELHWKVDSTGYKEDTKIALDTRSDTISILQFSPQNMAESLCIR